MPSTQIRKQQDDSDAALLRRLLRTSDRTIREAFLRAVNQVRSQDTLLQIADLLDTGNIEEALRFIEVIPAAVSTAVTFSIVNSGQEVSSLLSRVLSIPTSFDQTNQRAVAIMRESRLRLISQFTEQQREATSLALTDGIERGLNPREQARNFRNSIGLTAYQQQAVMNYRSLLESGSRQALNRRLRDARFDRTVVNAIESGNVLNETQIDRMVDRYQERFIRYRSEVIARTEALRAVHQGTEEMYQQAFDSGELSPAQLERTWLIAGGTNAQGQSRTRDTHLPMNGQQRPIGEAFVSGAGVSLRYPGDEDAPASETTQCRCIITTRFI